MQIIRISELDKKRVKIVLEDGTCFLLYKAEQRRYDLTEGEELFFFTTKGRNSFYRSEKKS